MKVSFDSPIQFIRYVFAGVVLLAYAAIGFAQDAPIIQPGAPGETPQEISAEQALEIADTGHSKADAQFMTDMIPHHNQAVQMSALVADRTNRPELVDVADAVVRGLEKYLSHPAPVLTPALLDEVDRHDWLRDRRVRLTSPSAEEGEAHATSGVCVGIAPDGALLFRPDRGALRRVQAGTVTAE